MTTTNSDSQRPLAGQVAIITGGGRGIGRAIAIAYAEAGASVCVTARTSAEIDKVAAEISEVGGRSLAVTCDVSDRPSVESMIERTIDEFGRLDILMNNAGGGLERTLVGEDDPPAEGVVRLVALHDGDVVRRVEFLQATANPIDAEIVGVKGRAAILREVARGLSMPVEDVVPSEEDLEIQDKMKQLQELMNNILDDETKKLYDELRELLEEKSEISEFREKIEEMKNKGGDLEKELERTLELFKKLQFDMKLEQNIKELEKAIEAARSDFNLPYVGSKKGFRPVVEGELGKYGQSVDDLRDEIYKRDNY